MPGCPASRPAQRRRSGSSTLPSISRIASISLRVLPGRGWDSTAARPAWTGAATDCMIWTRSPVWLDFSPRICARSWFRAPIQAQRGELMITERVADRLPFLSSTIRQVDEGGLQIGGTKAETDCDTETTTTMVGLAQHAVAVWPRLADLRVLRSWAALRVMTPDGYPIYQRSADHPGAFLVTCHSGVTLAPLHATRLAEWIDGDPAAPDLEAFDERRFALS